MVIINFFYKDVNESFDRYPNRKKIQAPMFVKSNLGKVISKIKLQPNDTRSSIKAIEAVFQEIENKVLILEKR